MIAGIFIENAAKGSTSVITNQTGLYISDLSSGTTNYAIYTNAGLVRIGDTTAATAYNAASVTLAGGLGVAGAIITNSNLTVAGIRTVSTDTITGAGAVSVTKDTTKITTNGVGNAMTLADGVDGQVKCIILDVLGAGGQTAILTPTTKTGYTTVTFTAAGQSVCLEFVTTRGWIVRGSFGATIV
jgi:hypothetical protein